MKKHPLLDRTALTAIAAALALLSTPALAQDATPPDPVTINPVTVPTPPRSAPAAEQAAPAPVAIEPVPAPPLQTVQSVPTQPEAQPAPAALLPRSCAQPRRAMPPVTWLRPRAPQHRSRLPVPTWRRRLSRSASPAALRRERRARRSRQSACRDGRAGGCTQLLDHDRRDCACRARKPCIAGLPLSRRSQRSPAARVDRFARRNLPGPGARSLAAAREVEDVKAPVLAAEDGGGCPRARQGTRQGGRNPARGHGQRGASAENPFLTRKNRTRRANFILAPGTGADGFVAGRRRAPGR